MVSCETTPIRRCTLHASFITCFPLPNFRCPPSNIVCSTLFMYFIHVLHYFPYLPLSSFICPFQTQEVAGTPASPLPLPTPSMDGFINLASLTNIIRRWKCYSRTWTCLMNRRFIVWQPRASYLTELGWTWNVQYVSVYACLSSVTVCVCAWDCFNAYAVTCEAEKDT